MHQSAAAKLEWAFYRKRRHWKIPKAHNVFLDNFLSIVSPPPSISLSLVLGFWVPTYYASFLELILPNYQRMAGPLRHWWHWLDRSMPAASAAAPWVAVVPQRHGAEPLIPASCTTHSWYIERCLIDGNNIDRSSPGKTCRFSSTESNNDRGRDGYYRLCPSIPLVVGIEQIANGWPIAYLVWIRSLGPTIFVPGELLSSPHSSYW